MQHPIHSANPRLRFPPTAYLALLSLFLASPLPLPAHEAPEEVVHELSSEITDTGETVPLLFERAMEYRALGKTRPAMADLREAIRLQSGFIDAYLELARLQESLGQSEAALATVNHAMQHAPHPGGRAAIYILRAEIHATRGEWQSALADCRLAFKYQPAPNLEWYLLRSRIQRRLGLSEDRARGLKAAYDAIPSQVLKIAWLEALIDAGHPAQALPQIEMELRSSRWKSSWLLRRAMARAKMGDEKKARRDASAALAEINQRLVPGEPELTLLADRSLAQALLGNTTAARLDLDNARRLGADQWVTAQAERYLEQPRENPPAPLERPPAPAP